MKTKIILMAILVLTFIGTASAIYTEYTVCQQDQLCKYTKNCTGTVCRDTLSQCNPCEPGRKWCADGTLSMCPNTCITTATGAACGYCDPVCESMDEKAWIGLFTVYVNKTIILTITPENTGQRPGGYILYNIHLENPNKMQTSVDFGIDAPEEWLHDEIPTITLSSGQYEDFQFPVAIPKDASEGIYEINFLAVTNNFGNTLATSNVTITAKQQATIAIDPAIQTGTADKPINYTITIVNNDDVIYDPTIYFLVPQMPKGWKASMQNRVVVSPGESADVDLMITPNMSAKRGLNNFTIIVSYGSMQENATATLNVVFCGDNVCQPEEIITCPEDCPAESVFVCSGRCEQKTDTGVNFTTRLQGMIASQFIVCNRKYSIDSCILDFDNSACGLGKSCICGNAFSTNCAIDCFDTEDAYFMAAKVPEGNIFSNNYSFECPQVGVSELKDIAANFTASIIQYERGQSMLMEKITQSHTPEERSQFQPCYDALGVITSNISSHVAYMNEVIAKPSFSGGVYARSKTRELRYFISQIYQKYCGASSPKGLLVIDSIDPPMSTEEGYAANATVNVRNIDNADYYSYVECTFTSPTKQTFTGRTECKRMEFNKTEIFTPGIESNITGDWEMKCGVYGSVDYSCNGAQLHSESDSLPFEIYSQKTYVADVYGSCISESAANCTVGTNRDYPDCIGCKLNNRQCTYVGQDKGLTYFRCPAQPIGYYNMTAYVYMTDNCIPVIPEQKTIQVRCGGCGDNIVDNTEECESPNTPNNAYCGQTDWQCSGMKYGVRDKFGYCGACVCYYDAFNYRCDKTRCGAQCSDGEVQIKTIKKSSGEYCSCVQQCGADCGWLDCSCEPINRVMDFAYPYENSKVQGEVNVKVVTVLENVLFAYSSLDPTCDGSKWYNMTKQQTGIFQIRWNTTSFKDGTYYLCARGYDQAGNEQKAYLKNLVVDNYDFKIDYLKAAGTGPANKGIDMSFLIKNTGTLPDTFTVVRSDSSPWAVTLKVSGASGSKVDVQPYQTADVTATITPVSSATIGDMQIIQIQITSDKTGIIKNAELALTVSSVANNPPRILNVVTEPRSVEQGKSITFSSYVSDTNGDNVNVDFCRDQDCVARYCSASYTGTAFTCAMTAGMSPGLYTYFVYARDSRGAVSMSDSYDFTVYTTTKQLQNLSIISKNITLPGTKQCSISIPQKSCDYDSATNRYTVRAGVVWSGGNHAHAEIEGDTGKMFYDSSFVNTKIVSGQGWKSVTALVHDADNNVICINSTKIYCGEGGTSDGSDIDMIRVANDVEGMIKTGDLKMKLSIAPTKASKILLTEHIKNGLIISDWSASGNRTPIARLGPNTVIYDGKDFNSYIWSINAGAYENITITYTTTITEPGLYRFVAVANNTVSSSTKDLTYEATSCASLVGTYAVSPQGDCLRFKTPCHVQSGWKPVEKCPSQTQATEGGIDIFTIILLVVVAGIIAALVWKREEVRDFLEELWFSIKNRGEKLE